jgi:hypothetical protein
MAEAVTRCASLQRGSRERFAATGGALDPSLQEVTISAQGERTITDCV